jgi:hypothetical protein
MVDPVEMKLLHMITADPARTPTFTMFVNPNYFLFAGAPNCASPCVTEPPSFAWNHGDVSPDINVTWLGMVGPGINRVGVDKSTWSDHTDVRPTVLSLVGLKDDYIHDGRVLIEEFAGWAVPAAVKKSGSFKTLAQVYKQLNAGVGQFGLATLKVSTQALKSGSASDDSLYMNLENQLISLGSARDAIAAQIIALLDGAEFNNQPIAAKQIQQLVMQSLKLLSQINMLTR